MAPADAPASTATRSTTGGTTESCIVVLAPIGRDAALLAHMFAAHQITTIAGRSLAEVIDYVRDGIGAVVLTEEALQLGKLQQLIALLGTQPAWSDLPIVLLLASDDSPSRAIGEVATLRAARNVTVLRRPVPGITLVSAVQALLSGRHRQYEVRDLIAREQAARAHAEEASRIKDEFLATISHELRTPLGAILLWSQLLAAGRLDDAQARDAIAKIIHSAEAQSRLVEDLLDVSRMLAGKLRLDVEPCALGPLAEATVDVVRPMAQARGVRIEVALADGEDRVLVDPERIRQILWNLVTNAVKFTPPGGRVAVVLSREDQHVVVRVTDTGKGITADLLPHIFERFRQGGGIADRGGLGLGLAIVHQLAELHGGTIDAASDGAGTGATFTLRLTPLAHGQAGI